MVLSIDKYENKAGIKKKKISLKTNNKYTSFKLFII